MNKFYKIRNVRTGLYSATGERWTKTGKTWKSRSALSNHFALYTESGLRSRYMDCVIEEIEEIPTGTLNIDEWMNGVVERRKAKEAAHKRYMQNYHKEQRRAEYEKLKREFEA